MYSFNPDCCDFHLLKIKDHLELHEKAIIKKLNEKIIELEAQITNYEKQIKYKDQQINYYMSLNGLI